MNRTSRTQELGTPLGVDRVRRNDRRGPHGGAIVLRPRGVEVLARGLRVGLLLGSAVVACGAGAQEIAGYPTAVTAYDPREVALLPRYCHFTQSFRDRVPGGNDAAEVARWYEFMGPIFHTMHHYCWGLMKNNRAMRLARDAPTKQFYLSDAINEYNYVIERASDEFVLLPEILTKKGENLIRLGRGPQGLLELERALSLKADYWPAHAAISDYHKSLGDTKKAREALQAGLALTPDAKGLLRRLADLGSGTEPPPKAN